MRDGQALRDRAARLTGLFPKDVPRGIVSGALGGCMPVWIGKAWLTREDLERERAFVRNLRFGPPDALWRRVLCRLLHWRNHRKAELDASRSCKCSRCGHAWTERVRAPARPSRT